MSKVKSLLAVLNDLRSLGSSIQALCDAMESDEQPDTEEAMEKVKKKSEITLEEVRGILADKSRAGHTAEIRVIIEKYGVDRLSDIDPKDYAAIIKEAEVLG